MASIEDVTFDAERVALEFHAHVAGLVNRTVDAHEQGTLDVTADLPTLTLEDGPGGRGLEATIAFPPA